MGVRRWSTVVTVCVLVVTGLATTAVRSPHAHAAAATADLSKPPIPATGAYLGAYVDPIEAATGSPVAAVPNGIAQTASFESDIGRPLGFDNHFFPWSSLTPQGVQQSGLLIGPAQFADAKVGTIPMLSWVCYAPRPGDPHYAAGKSGDAAILDGDEDDVIKAAATSIRDFGHPVILRYSWEMNLDSDRNEACQGSLGPAGYVLAWQHIYDIFQEVGATNAAFAWVPSTAVPAAGADQYYPGDGYVDWVGADGYSRAPAADADPLMRPFATIFGAFYQEWSGRKPILVGETGVAGSPATQVAWLENMFAVLPTAFPDIKAVGYFDAQSSLSDFRLGSAAETAFATGGAEDYFEPRSPTVPLAFSTPRTVVRTTPNVALPAAPTPDAPSPDALSVAVTGSPAAVLSRSGDLPPGVWLALEPGSASATFLGTPQQPGLYQGTITATSSTGAVNQAYSFEVDGAPTIKQLPEVLGGPVGAPRSFAVVTHAYPPDSVTVTGLPANFAFHPDGSGGGSIVGTPTKDQGGAYPVTISATNSLGSTHQSHRIVVSEAASVATTDAVAAYVGAAFSTTVGTIGYPAPRVYVAQLPPWLHAVDNKDGTATISGVPPAPTVLTIRVVMTQTTYRPTSAGGVDSVAKTSYDILVTVH